MNHLTRRKFIREVATCATMAGLSAYARPLQAIAGATPSVHGVSAAIPMPIQVVIDDVGWWSGKDGSEQQEPFRTGFDRDQKMDDYRAIVALGKAPWRSIFPQRTSWVLP